MKIIKLEKIRLANVEPVIRVTYKNWYSSKERTRDAIKQYLVWIWADTGSMIRVHDTIEYFNSSNMINYSPNDTSTLVVKRNEPLKSYEPEDGCRFTFSKRMGGWVTEVNEWPIENDGIVVVSKGINKKSSK